MKLITVEQSILESVQRKLRNAEKNHRRVRQVVLTESEYTQLREELGSTVKSVDDVPVFVEDSKGVVVPAWRFEHKTAE